MTTFRDQFGTPTDFSRTEAERWVEQEFAKHNTRGSIIARIDSEERSMKMFALLPGDWTNSKWAHNELVRRLREELA